MQLIDGYLRPTPWDKRNFHIDTYELSEALVQANKDFDMAIYTDKDHGIYGGNTRVQLYRKMTNFIKKNL